MLQLQQSLDTIRIVVGLVNTGHLELAVLRLHESPNKTKLFDLIVKQLDADQATKFRELYEVL